MERQQCDCGYEGEAYYVRRLDAWLCAACYNAYIDAAHGRYGPVDPPR